MGSEICIRDSGGPLVVAMPDPWDQRLLDELRFMAEHRVLAVAALPGTLGPAVARAFRASPPPVEEAPAPVRVGTLRDLAAENIPIAFPTMTVEMARPGDGPPDAPQGME